MGNARDTGYLQNIVTYDANDNIILPANLNVGGAATFASTVTVLGNLHLQGTVTKNINFYDSSNTNINAQIQYDQISSTSGQLFFRTNNAGTFATRLTISNTGAATFSSSVTAQNGLIVSGSAGTTGFARFTDSVTASMFVGINSGTPYIHSNNSTLSFGANGSNTFAPTMTLSSGNVGIGVTPNSWGGTNVKALEVYLASMSASLTYGTAFTFNTFYDTAGNWKYIGPYTAGKYEIGGDEHIWYNAPSGSAGATATFTPRMKITSSGNVLIGTQTDNGYKLRVNGPISSDSVYYSIRSSGDLVNEVQNGGTAVNRTYTAFGSVPMNGGKFRLAFTGYDRQCCLIKISVSGGWTASNTSNRHFAMIFNVQPLVNSSGSTIFVTAPTALLSTNISTGNVTATSLGGNNYTIDIVNPLTDVGETALMYIKVEIVGQHFMTSATVV